MKPPPDRQLDLNGSATDLPLATTRPSSVRWPLVLGIATILGLVSTTLAWQFTLSLGRSDVELRMLLFLNLSYWYLWAAFTPAIVYLSQCYRFEWQGLTRALAVHLPAVIAFSFGHIAAMGGVQWWLATTWGREFVWWAEVQRSALQSLDWEMMTYWTIVGMSHAVLYYRESKRRALRAAQLETKLVEAELQTLQQQLHPHFLFNTLNAISTLMHRDVEAADRTLICLSDMLRMSLDNSGRREITLHDELEFLRKYVQIEQIRFADRLVVRYEIDPHSLDALVPTLILQPIVENAIKHGVARKSGAGHIDIAARRDGDMLLLEIRDDGVGLSEDALTALQKGIGVSTTRARLQRLFGADYRFEFHRRPAGLSVVIGFPWHTAVDQPVDAKPPRRASPPRAAKVGRLAGADLRG